MEIYNALALAYKKTGSLPKAIETYRKAIERSPNALVYYKLGEAYYQSQRYSEAVDALESARKLDRRRAHVTDLLERG